MIDSYLRLFNLFGEQAKILFFDPDRSELDPVTNINDINKGSLHNSIEWSNRYSKRVLAESDIRKAKKQLLSEWGNFLGIPRTNGQTDEEYYFAIREKIIASDSTTNSVLRYVDLDDANVLEGNTVGLFLDNSYFDIGLDEPVPGSVLVDGVNAIYIIFENLSDINKRLLSFINETKAFGTSIFVGYKNG